LLIGILQLIPDAGSSTAFNYWTWLGAGTPVAARLGRA
jgi:hypothetical protein